MSRIVIVILIYDRHKSIDKVKYNILMKGDKELKL
jgi:hypothetical protein